MDKVRRLASSLAWRVGPDGVRLGRAGSAGWVLLRWIIAVMAIAAGSAVQAQTRHRATPSLAAICGPCRVEKYASCGGFLEGPVEDARGMLWLVDVVGGRILEVDPAGTCRERLKTGTHPNGAQMRSDGKLVIAGSTGLLLYDTASNRMETVPVVFQGRSLTGLNDLVLAPDGGIYFTVPGSSSFARPDGEVFFRSPRGDLQKLGGQFAYPNGIELSPDGQTLLVANFAAKEIISLPAVTSTSPFATTFVHARTQGGIGPDGMRADRSGNLFVANLGTGEVLVYDPRARLIGTLPLPPGAGALTTNVTVGRRYLYISEASRGEVWRVRLK